MFPASTKESANTAGLLDILYNFGLFFSINGNLPFTVFEHNQKQKKQKKTPQKHKHQKH